LKLTKYNSGEDDLRAEIEALVASAPRPSGYDLTWSDRAKNEWRVTTFHSRTTRRFSFRALVHELEAEIEGRSKALPPDRPGELPDLHPFLLVDALEDALNRTYRLRLRRFKRLRGLSSLREIPLRRSRYQAALAFRYFRGQLDRPKSRRYHAVKSLQALSRTIPILQREAPYKPTAAQNRSREAKGYYWASFEDSWRRYLPSVGSGIATPPQVNADAGSRRLPSRHTEAVVAESERLLGNADADCGDVADAPPCPERRSSCRYHVGTIVMPCARCKRPYQAHGDFGD
jgi:hypothetical protein